MSRKEGEEEEEEPPLSENCVLSHDSKQIQTAEVAL